MANTLSSKQLEDILAMINKNKGTNLKLSKSGTFASNTMDYGAGGKGEYVPTDKEAQTLANNAAGGAPASEYGNVLGGYGGYTPVPTLNAAKSSALAKSYGLQGMADSEFVGLTQSQANAKAQQIKEGKLGQISANTSFGYDPQTIAGSKKVFDDLVFRVNESTNQPWNSSMSTKDTNKALVTSYEDQFAKQFQTQDQFKAAMASPEFQQTMNQYKQMGGDPNAIAAKIGQTPGSNMEISQYLGAITNPEQQKAMEALIPEQQIYQQQIAQQYGIAKAYQDAYFGTEDQIGFLEKERKLKEEQIKLKEREAKLDKENLRAQADFAKEKANAELQIASNEIEENRLAAKNYMTGMLAKMGALKTTGAAPLALATLEQKYQKQSQELQTKYKFYNREVEIKLDEQLDNIDINRDNDIWKIKNDLSKSEEDTWKEIVKLQNDADENALKVIEKYASEFRTLSESYRKEAKSDAEKYAKKMASTITSYDFSSAIEGGVVLKRGKTGSLSGVGVANPLGGVSNMEGVMEANAGADGKLSPDFYKKMYDKFIQANGTRTEFLSKFPPKRWVNPNDDQWLPEHLRYKQTSGTLTKADEETSSTDTASLIADLQSMIDASN